MDTHAATDTARRAKKWPPETRTAIVTSVRAGAFRNAAAKAAGVPVGTLSWWVVKGNAELAAAGGGEPTELGKFVLDLLEAERLASGDLLARTLAGPDRPPSARYTAVCGVARRLSPSMRRALIGRLAGEQEAAGRRSHIRLQPIAAAESENSEAPVPVPISDWKDKP